MTDRAPPDTTNNGLCFARMDAAGPARVIPFPRERIVRVLAPPPPVTVRSLLPHDGYTDPYSGLQLKQRVTFHRDARQHEGILIGIAYYPTSTSYSVLCDDGIIRAVDVPHTATTPDGAA